jgi:hypothetical protein
MNFMIRDANGHPKSDLEITIKLRNAMMSSIQKSIIRNLQAIKEFLKIQGYEDVCAGLYTFAVEEYGKILFLQSCTVTTNNTIKFHYRRDGRKGFLNHDEKFTRALNDKQLPDACKKLSEGGFTSSGFTPTGFITDTPADFEARMALFYADFKDGNSILEPPRVNRQLLENAVDEFLNLMNNQTF